MVPTNQRRGYMHNDVYKREVKWRRNKLVQRSEERRTNTINSCNHLFQDDTYISLRKDLQPFRGAATPCSAVIQARLTLLPCVGSLSELDLYSFVVWSKAYNRIVLYYYVMMMILLCGELLLLMICFLAWLYHSFIHSFNASSVFNCDF